LQLSGRLSGASSQNRKAGCYRRFAAFERAAMENNGRPVLCSSSKRLSSSVVQGAFLFVMNVPVGPLSHYPTDHGDHCIADAKGKQHQTMTSS
jgi:hypothetical protein